MGLIGLLVTVLVIVLGFGYAFFGGSLGTSLTVINDRSPLGTEEGLNRYEAVKDEVLNVKQLTEERVEETIKSADTPVPEAASPKEEGVSPVKEDADLRITHRLMSTGFTALDKPRVIDTLVLHSSYDLNGTDPFSIGGIIKEYEDYGVSAHYLIGRKGDIYRLVEDRHIAYHAGVSKMPDGRRNANDFSIGIELVNTQTGSLTEAQYDALNSLIAFLKKKYPIKSIVGHSDIAPDRKTDPWNFDWKKLR